MSEIKDFLGVMLAFAIGWIGLRVIFYCVAYIYQLIFQIKEKYDSRDIQGRGRRK